MSTLTVHCQWEDETVRERTGHLPSYAEAKKMKSSSLSSFIAERNAERQYALPQNYIVGLGKYTVK